MKFRNCTKSGKANAEIFSELPWNYFRIMVVVSDLNSEFRIFFLRSIRSILTILNFFFKLIRTIPNFFLEFRTDFRIICGKNMEIHQNPLFFHENNFFLIRKSPNTPNSIFRANIRNLLLQVNRFRMFCKQYYLRGCVTISLEVVTTIAEYSHNLSLFSRSTGYM